MTFDIPKMKGEGQQMIQPAGICSLDRNTHFVLGNELLGGGPGTGSVFLVVKRTHRSGPEL